MEERRIGLDLLPQPHGSSSCCFATCDLRRQAAALSRAASLRKTISTRSAQVVLLTPVFPLILPMASGTLFSFSAAVALFLLRVSAVALSALPAGACSHQARGGAALIAESQNEAVQPFRSLFRCGHVALAVGTAVPLQNSPAARPVDVARRCFFLTRPEGAPAVPDR